jgi:hypothetical protein
MSARGKHARISNGSSLNRTRNQPARTAIRKVGVKQLKAGTHPQQWRQTGATPAKTLSGHGAKLGPMGELGDDVILEVGLTMEGERLLKIRAPEWSLNNIKTLFRNEVYDPLQEHVDQKIDLWVPMDTGELRNSMHNALTPSGGSKTNDFPFKILLNTEGIPYAKPVNNMPSDWLQHPGGHFINRGRFGGSLLDEDAKKGWYNLVLVNGRSEARKLVEGFIRDTIQDLIRTNAGKLGVFGNYYQKARSMFSIKYL